MGLSVCACFGFLIDQKVVRVYTCFSELKRDFLGVERTFSLHAYGPRAPFCG